ncbi:unnamed protein product [Calypogeia fissa]
MGKSHDSKSQKTINHEGYTDGSFAPSRTGPFMYWPRQGGVARQDGASAVRPGAGSLGGTANAEERWEGAQATVSLLLRQEADPPKLPVLGECFWLFLLMPTEYLANNALLEVVCGVELGIG